MSAYLDSCVVIYLIERREPWFEEIRDRLLPVSEPLPLIWYSDLTRMECRVGPKLRGDAVALSEYDNFFETARFRRIVMDHPVFDLATDLRVRHRIAVPDALHLAAAMCAGCEEFWTNDLTLEKAAEGRLQVVTLVGRP
jgi:predicted nucleic acid-binding protein